MSCFSSGIVAFLPRCFASPAALRHQAPRGSVSGRPLYLAAGGFGRSGGFFTRHRIFHAEHIGRIAFRRAGLPPKPHPPPSLPPSPTPPTPHPPPPPPR